MKRFLNAAALLTLLGTLTFWFTNGAHTGWSQNRVPTSKTDDITGIVYTVYEDRYVPGLDVLGGGLILSVLIFLSSLMIRSTSSPKIQP